MSVPFVWSVRRKSLMTDSVCFFIVPANCHGRLRQSRDAQIRVGHKRKTLERKHLVSLFSIVVNTLTRS